MVAMIKTMAFTFSLIACWPASAFDRGDVIEGAARVIDGDTLDVEGVRVRLNGVAAPERDEPGGSEATDTMWQIIEAQTVRCSLTGETTYKRQVGTCWIETLDVGAALIAAGRARDCPRYSGGRYASLETSASQALPLPRYCR